MGKKSQKNKSGFAWIREQLLKIRAQYLETRDLYTVEDPSSFLFSQVIELVRNNCGEIQKELFRNYDDLKVVYNAHKETLFEACDTRSDDNQMRKLFEDAQRAYYMTIIVIFNTVIIIPKINIPKNGLKQIMIDVVDIITEYIR